MRSTVDRLRHTVLFELFGVITCAPLAAWILNKSLAQVGSLSIALSLLAMCVNYAYNYFFDVTLIKLGRQLSDRPPWLRVVHAVMFEGSLVILTVPVVAWWLDMNLWQAFLTDLGFVLFFLVYAYVYNWGYDIVFPIPEHVQTG